MFCSVNLKGMEGLLSGVFLCWNRDQYGSRCLRTWQTYDRECFTSPLGGRRQWSGEVLSMLWLTCAPDRACRLPRGEGHEFGGHVERRQGPRAAAAGLRKC